jgi:hypothetical protein
MTKLNPSMDSKTNQKLSRSKPSKNKLIVPNNNYQYLMIILTKINKSNILPLIVKKRS